MRKVIFSSVMIGGTLLSAMSMVAWTPYESPIEARIVQVKRGDVHQVVALSGSITYADERILYAQTNGRVEQICAIEGDRVGESEALVRLKADPAQWIAASVAATNRGTEEPWPQPLLDSFVIRADAPCTVREVYVQEQAPVTAGIPVVRVSSHQKEIVCVAASVDADRVQRGMWAWLSKSGTSYGFAEVLSVGEKRIDPNTGLKYAEVRLRPEQHIELLAGEKLNVDVYIAGSDNVMTLPVEAVTERNTVWWVNEGRCTEIPAGIVMTDEMLAWVDLPEGISVAVGEFYEGQPVTEAHK